MDIKIITTNNEFEDCSEDEMYVDSFAALMDRIDTLMINWIPQSVEKASNGLVIEASYEDDSRHEQRIIIPDCCGIEETHIKRIYN